MLFRSEVAERPTRDWYSSIFTTMPVSIAEIELGPGLRFGPVTAVDTGCVTIATVDGSAVRASIEGSAKAALEREELRIVGCGSVRTETGGFTVQTAGRLVGFDIDQLVLRSPRELPAPEVPLPVSVLEQDDTSYLLGVPGSARERWLVLGQSYNLGWSAKLDGRSLGDPVLIDGFANGWRIPPGEDQRVELEWTPQRLVGRSIWISVVVILLAVFIAFRGRRVIGHLTAARPDGPAQPTLRPLPIIEETRRLPRGPWLSALVAGGGLAAFSWMNLPRLPGLAIVVGLAVVVALRVRTRWTMPALSGAIIFGLTSLAIMVAQRRFRYPPDFGWPQQFSDLHVYGVVCLLLLAGDYVVAAVAPDRTRVDPEIEARAWPEVS